jgi:hypothetical protein
MRSQNHRNCGDRDLVEELIGEESEDNHTHKPDGTHNILNEVVVDRGPNPSTYPHPNPSLVLLLTPNESNVNH